MNAPAIRHACALIVLIGILGNCSAAESEFAGDDSTSFCRAGLFIDAGAGIHHSSISNNGGYEVSLGVGFIVTSQISLKLQFRTGDENVAAQPARPVWGRFLLGGGSLESQLFLSGNGGFRPYATLGYGFLTILENGAGYSGGGLQVGVGIQAEHSKYFSSGVSLEYSFVQFHTLVGDIDPAGTFVPFTNHRVAVAISVTFYPNILP